MQIRFTSLFVSVIYIKQIFVDENWLVCKFQRGDFVIERKDRYNYESFPVWKIEAGKLLQKYEPVVNDTAVLHKSVSIVGFVFL